MARSTIKQAPNGFSLIEIIIALAVLGIGLIALMSYLPVVLDTAKKSSDLAKVVMVARNQIERVRAAAFDTIQDADALDTAGAFEDDPDFSGFQYRIDVQPKGGGPGVTSKDITVEVRWLLRSAWQSKTFQTKIVKYNPG